VNMPEIHRENVNKSNRESSRLGVGLNNSGVYLGLGLGSNRVLANGKFNFDSKKNSVGLNGSRFDSQLLEKTEVFDSAPRYIHDIHFTSSPYLELGTVREEDGKGITKFDHRGATFANESPIIGDHKYRNKGGTVIGVAKSSSNRNSVESYRRVKGTAKKVDFGGVKVSRDRTGSKSKSRGKKKLGKGLSSSSKKFDDFDIDRMLGDYDDRTETDYCDSGRSGEREARAHGRSGKKLTQNRSKKNLRP
jgi:hypothetical protein